MATRVSFGTVSLLSGCFVEVALLKSLSLGHKIKTWVRS